MDITILEAAKYAITGYGVVFLGIILLMLVIMVIGSIFTAKEKKAASVPAPAPVESPKATAPGTAGQLKLHDVEPKTAAMLMAIVADKLGKPLNELRFISIKEDK